MSDDEQETDAARSAKLAAELRASMYTRRDFRARLRKAEFDAHVRAGFNELQALILVSKLI